MKNLVYLLTTLVLVSCMPSYAENVTVEATFNEGLPIHLNSSDVHTSIVDFKTSFKSLTYVCFTPVFESDLIDTNEGYWIGPFQSTNGTTSFGWRNTGAESVASRKACIGQMHFETSLFLDGVESVGIKMSAGQGTLTKLIVTATGEVDEAIPDPTFFVDIQLDKGEGTVSAQGGKVQYYGVIGNDDYDHAFTSYYRWSSLTFPSGEHYPIHKSKVFDINAGDRREFKSPRLTIPAWFPAGDYILTWYVADPRNPDHLLVSDSFSFTKVAI